MLDDFKLNRGLLSSYYISAIFTFFVFQIPLMEDVVRSIASWLINALEVLINFRIDIGGIWIVLFLVCFLITSFLRKFVVYPLGFYINDEGAPAWELIVLATLVLGFYTYLLNQVFSEPMPSQTPIIILRLVDGYDNTYAILTQETYQETITWSIVPWFWYFFPLAFMYVRTKLMKDKDEK
jgi:hypothetical protein